MKLKLENEFSELDLLFKKADDQLESGNLRSAFRLFMSGAKRNDSGAQHMLGYCYRRGIGVKPNREAALKWYKKAFSHGKSISAINIGIIYRDENNTRQALKWFQKAVDLDDDEANLEIAKILIKKCESAKALFHLKKIIAADRNYVTEASICEAQHLIKELENKKSESSKPPK